MDVRTRFAIMLITLGLLAVLGGLAVLLVDKIPYFGRLPGDISIHGKGWSFHFPVVTGLVISIILTIILNLIFRR